MPGTPPTQPRLPHPPLTQSPQHAPHCVVGYGSELRGDDALGPAVAAAVAAKQLPGVRVLTRHQLLPELAADLAQARRIVFVDASARPEQHAVQVRPLAPSPKPRPHPPVAPPPAVPSRPPGPSLAHSLRPDDLLALTSALYGRWPPAWLVTVPAERFAWGAPLSARAEQALPAAVQAVCALCQAP
ncbi:MAG: hydrogenase maturation protease [Verrucomicrobia bacterium]|nr:hydrogenase maturation protease [Verrucomicrobiota bacterium]